MRESRWRRLEGKFCLYCGVIADSDDHFPPQSVAHSGWLLPACRPCNSALGNRWHGNLLQRIRVAKESIARKTKKLRQQSTWDDDDIKALGPNMRREVKLWQERKRIAHARLAWNAEAYLAFIDRDSAFARFLVEIGGTRRLARKS